MQKRLQYTRNTYLFSSDTLLVRKRGGGERPIPPHKWFIDRNTPVGEDADLYERMPYGGRRWIEPEKILAVLRDPKLPT